MITYIIIFSAKKRTKFFAPLGTVGHCWWGRIVLAHYFCRTRAATTCWVSAHILRYVRGVLALTLSLSWCAVFVSCFFMPPIRHCPFDLYTIHIFYMSGPANSTCNHGGRTQRGEWYGSHSPYFAVSPRSPCFVVSLAVSQIQQIFADHDRAMALPELIKILSAPIYVSQAHGSW